MELQPKLKIQPIHKLKLSPQIKLNIKLLQLPLFRLAELIKQQAEENPLLELEESLPDESFKSNQVEGKQQYKETLITKPTTLFEHLSIQLPLVTQSGQQQKIGESIIGNLDDNGYLRISLTEIAQKLKTSKSKVEKMLALVQTLDPSGIGARNLRECLLIQLYRTKKSKNSLCYQIVDKYLYLLEKKRFNFIAKKLSSSDKKVSVEKVKQTVGEIAKLEPKPGRSLAPEKRMALIPDVLLKKNRDKFEIVFNDWELPRIKLNRKYRKMLEQKDTPCEARQFLKEKLTAAKKLIEATKKRKQTILDVTETIIQIQNDFFKFGKSYFKPMNLSSVAKIINKHKSTVSRTVTEKYLQTPSGIFELRSFLNSAITQKNGKFLSSKMIKEKIKIMVGKENKQKPLTDQQIHKLLKTEKMEVSRRAIAKYRSQLKILPSQSRKE